VILPLAKLTTTSAKFWFISITRPVIVAHCPDTAALIPESAGAVAGGSGPTRCVIETSSPALFSLSVAMAVTWYKPSFKILEVAA